MAESNWSTIKHRKRGSNTLAALSKDDELDLRPVHNAGAPITGTTAAPKLVGTTGPDGHTSYAWEWPDDPAYIAEAERFAYRRAQRKGQL